MKKRVPLRDEDVAMHALYASVFLKGYRSMPVSKVHEILDGVDELVATRGVVSDKLRKAVK